MRDAEMTLLKTDAGIQAHLQEKWEHYKTIADGFRNFWATKREIILDELIPHMEGDLSTYDFQIQLESFCATKGFSTTQMRNIMARLLLSWPDLSHYPKA